MQIRQILRNFILTLLCLLLLVACATQPEPVEAPVEEATEELVEEATEEPAEEPTKAPVEETTEAPVEEATEEPAEEPTEEATEEPLEEATEEPVEQEAVDESDTDAEYATESGAADESEAADGTEEVALQLLEQYGCLSCHRYADQGSFVGPDLDDIGAKYEADFIRESIVDPAAVIADGAVDLMPKDYGDKISEEELTQIVEFLVASTGE